MIFKLAFRNITSRKSSFVIILFIAFAIMLFCVANAIFDSTEQGVEQNFVSSFTGDLIIRPKNGTQQTSLFGDESPVTGELAKNEILVPYKDISDFLKSEDGIQTFTSQLSGYAVAEFGKKRKTLYLFGVNAENYCSMMTSLQIKEGQIFDDDEKSVMLYEKTAASLGVKLGDKIQFTVVDGISARIREATVCAIYTYKSPDSIFEKFALVSPQIFRSLMNITSENSENLFIDGEKQNLLEETDDLDSFFEDAEDMAASFDEESSLFDESENLANIENSEIGKVDSTSWNFIICHANKNVSRVIKNLNQTFKKNNWPVEAVSWRNAAGSTALYLYWIRIILNIGIVIILIAGFIIINNTLVVNILDRTVEIGTMRAIGAKRWFISLECMSETVVMAIAGGILGILLGIIVSFLITKANIHFGNSFLIQLFGSEALKVHVTFASSLKLMLCSLVIGILGWIYPVKNALKINPVQAMQGAK